jgi:co-chaperonin GroES (HSP10)
MAKWGEAFPVLDAHHRAAQEQAELGRLWHENVKENASGIRPVQYCVLVKPDDVEKTTKGGIILPDSKVEKDEFQRMEGVLVAVSPMAFTFKDWPEEAKGMQPQVGDRVIFAKYNATELTGRDGGKYWLMKDEAIVGVME